MTRLTLHETAKPSAKAHVWQATTMGLNEPLLVLSIKGATAAVDIHLPPHLAAWAEAVAAAINAPVAASVERAA